MDAEESPEEDAPLYSYVHPDDRLWRHPSEVDAVSGEPRPGPARAPGTGLLAGRHPAGPRLTMGGGTWTVALLAGAVGALVASGVWAVSGELQPRTTVLAPVTKVMTPNTLAAAAVASTATPSWASVVDAVAPSVASVTAWGGDGPETGSAVVYGTDDDGDVTYLMTDAGLVGQGGVVDVTFNGGVALRGHVMHIDPASRVALLSVDSGGHPSPALGSVDNLDVADAVMTLGGRSSGDSGPVAGSVSSVDRTVVDQETSATTSGLLAVSSTLPGGDDGGAVVDSDGTVVGLATDLVSEDPDDSGMSFAVPIDVADRVAQEVIDRQRVTDPWVGIESTSDLDSVTAGAMGVAGGAEVLQVADGSPAAAAGLQPDDVVTAFDRQPVTSSGSLLAQVEATQPGQYASLTYHRGSTSATVQVRIVEQPASPGS